jgi:hypothetical protein
VGVQRGAGVHDEAALLPADLRLHEHDVARHLRDGGCRGSGIRAEDLVDVDDLMPDATTDLILGISCGPKMGWTMIASYCFDVAIVCSCASCFFGSLAASNTVTFAPCALATDFAAASMGAS